MSGAPAGSSHGHCLARDLEEIQERAAGAWETLRGGRIFITGGTGFFGCWLLESFLWANNRLNLGAEAVVLTRDPAAFALKMPSLAGRKGLRFCAGDVRTFAFPEGGFTHVIHAATQASRAMVEREPLAMADTMIEGTRRVLDFARQRNVQKVLLTSSGAVYGRQPAELTHLPETYTGGPETGDYRSVYGEGKRTAELLCALYGKQYGLATTVARCFAFVGPHLPLDEGYAIGNFIRDGLAGGPIRIGGDGTPWRSYLYAGDLAAWLWMFLAKAPAGRTYNVGSGQALTIAETARTVAEAFDPRPEIVVAKKPLPGTATERYVPDVTRAKQELGLEAWTPLPEAIRRTVTWWKTQKS